MKSRILSTLVLLAAAAPAFAAELHVSSANGDDSANGSTLKPYKTICAAAQKAQPGDTITVSAGTYRETIDPPRGGTDDAHRITYTAAKGEKVVITGSDSGSTCGAWLCQHIWTHYDYTRDEAFLRENYPVLREACRFFLATLVTDPESGKLVTSPSNSPENSYRFTGPDGKKGETSLTYGATYDMQIIRELFQDTAAAASVLKMDSPLVAELDAAREKLAPTRVNAEGRIMEWIKDFEETDPHHRHTSPLWGLHPGTQTTPETPELFKGARLLLERRGDASTGWSMAWKANFWARLQDGDHSRKLLTMLIGRGAPNLFCMHPPCSPPGHPVPSKDSARRAGSPWTSPGKKVP
ncbi:MAG: DUF1565 domain-containing protein [Luteolibacter sp.]